MRRNLRRTIRNICTWVASCGCMVRGLQLWLRSLPNGLHGVREGQDDCSQPSISNVDSPVFHLFDLSMLIGARHSQVHAPEIAPNIRLRLLSETNLSGP